MARIARLLRLHAALRQARRAAFRPDRRMHDRAIASWRALAEAEGAGPRLQACLAMALFQKGEALRDREALLEAEQLLARLDAGDPVLGATRAATAQMLGTLLADETRLREAMAFADRVARAPSPPANVRAYALAIHALAALFLGHMRRDGALLAVARERHAEAVRVDARVPPLPQLPY